MLSLALIWWCNEDSGIKPLKPPSSRYDVTTSCYYVTFMRPLYFRFRHMTLRYDIKLCLCYLALRHVSFVFVVFVSWLCVMVCKLCLAVCCLDCTILRHMTILLCDSALCCVRFCHVTLHYLFIRDTKFSVNTLPYTLLIWSKMVTRWKPWTCSVDTVLLLILR